MTSAALTDIPWASSATVIVSGTATSRVMGSVGFSNACWPAVADVMRRGLIVGRGLRRPRLPSERCNSPPASSRSLDFRFLPFSSRRPPPFASSRRWEEPPSRRAPQVFQEHVQLQPPLQPGHSAQPQQPPLPPGHALRPPIEPASASAAAFASSAAFASFSASSCCRCNSPRRT